MTEVLYKVRCVDNTGLVDRLTVGEVYSVIDEERCKLGSLITIQISGSSHWYDEERFTRVEDGTEGTTQVKSSGGSSSYYDFRVWSSIECRYVEFKMGDLIRDGLYNSFDLGNMAKALKRVAEVRNGGGKVGTTEAYDLNKIKYFAEEELKIKEGRDVKA